MSTTATIENPINTRHQFRLKSPAFSTKLRLIYKAILVLLMIICIGATYYSGFNILVAGISLVVSGLIVFSIYQVFKRIVTGSVHGDYLIVTHRLTNKSKVVDIRHLKSIRSVRFLWLTGTKFTYNLDGEIKRVMLLCSDAEITNITQLLRDLKNAA